MILDDAILELFDAGIYEPAQVEQMLRQRGDGWLAEALLERSTRLIREHVRELAQKRAVLLPPKTVKTAGEPRRTMQDEYGPLKWIPGLGFKPLRDCTSSDLRGHATWQRVKAGELVSIATQFEAWADEMDAAGAQTFGDLGIEVAA